MAVTDLRDIGRWEPGSKARRYEVDWRDAKGKRNRKRFKLKADAVAFDAEVRLDLGGVRSRSKASAKTVDEAFREWIAWLRVHGGRSNDGASPSTIGGYESIHAQWVAPSLGPIRLGRLDRETVQEWRTSMTSKSGRTPSPRQRATADDQLVRLFNWCIDQEFISDNPAKTRSGARAPRPKVRKTKTHTYLDSRQVWRLAAHAPDETTRNIVLTMASTGLRFGEVAALTAGDFDPESGELRVRRSYAMDRGKMYLSRTKSHEERTVKVDGGVKALLRDRASSLTPDDLLFTTLTGRPINRDNWADRKFARAAKAASTAVFRLQESLGVKEFRGRHAWYGPRTAEAVEGARAFTSFGVIGYGERQFDMALNIIGEVAEHIDLREGDMDFPTPTPHDMRHTAASIAIRSGASVKAVQAMLGHASAKVTLDTYAGLFPDEQAAVASAMAEALSMPS